MSSPWVTPAELVANPELWPDSARLATATVEQLLAVAQTQCVAYAPELADGATVPTNYKTACVYQARELYGASLRSGDSIAGDFPIRVRPLTDAVKNLLRPPRGRARFGGGAGTPAPDALADETAARVAADDALAAVVDAEVAAREAADTSLSALIAAETAARVAGDSDVWTYALATVDTSVTGATPVNIAGLSVPPLPDGLYEFDFMIIGVTPADTVGLYIAPVFPATAPLIGRFLLPSAATSASQRHTGPGITTAWTSLSAPVANSPYLAFFARGVSVRASGMVTAATITLRSEDTTSTVVAKADSYIRWRKIAP